MNNIQVYAASAEQCAVLSRWQVWLGYSASSSNTKRDRGTFVFADVKTLEGGGICRDVYSSEGYPEGKYTKVSIGEFLDYYETHAEKRAYRLNPDYKKDVEKIARYAGCKPNGFLDYAFSISSEAEAAYGFELLEKWFIPIYQVVLPQLRAEVEQRISALNTSMLSIKQCRNILDALPQ